MAFTFKELKQAKQNIMDAFGLSSSDAVRVVGYFNGGGPALCPDIVTAMISGDLSGVGPALVALGIPSKDLQTNGPKTGPASDDLHGSTAATTADIIPAHDDLVHAPDGMPAAVQGSPQAVQNAPQRKENTQAAKRPTKQKKTNTSPQAVKGPDVVQGVHDDLGPDDLEHVQGESVNPHELPPGLYDDICSIIDGFAESHGIQDKQKIHPLQFAAACTLVGVSIKKRGLLMDVEFNRTHGGNKYNPEKVLALLYLYDYVCGNYRQVAFSHNFPKFAGVSREWFNDYMQRDLTSSRVGLAQKAHEIQKASLVGAITSGGSATVGNIFLGKALAGLQETVTIQHVSAASTPAAVALPVFGPDGGLLEDKRPE